jgi:hypothetical protein
MTTKRARRSRRLLAAAAAPAIAVGGLVLRAGPASASTVTSNQQFDIGGGTTCFLTLTQEYPVGGNRELARAQTEVTGGSGPNADACITSARAFVSADYFDPNGFEVTTQDNTDESFSVERYYAPVGSRLRTFHSVSWTVCGCSTQHYVMVQPK